MRIYIIDRQEYLIGRYKITLLIDQDQKIVGALIELPRRTKPVYIAINERVKMKLPREVIKFLKERGFKIEKQ